MKVKEIGIDNIDLLNWFITNGTDKQRLKVMKYLNSGLPAMRNGLTHKIISELIGDYEKKFHVKIVELGVAWNGKERNEDKTV